MRKYSFIILLLSICEGQNTTLSNKSHTNQTDTLYFVMEELDQRTGTLINDIRDLLIEINVPYWQGEKDASNRSHQEMEDLSFLGSLEYRCLLNRIRFEYFGFQLLVIDKFTAKEKLSVLDNMNHLCLAIQKISNEMSLEMLSIKNKELIQLGNTYSTYSELISEYGLRIVENLRLDD